MALRTAHYRMADTKSEKDLDEKVNNLSIHEFPKAYLAASFPRRTVWILFSMTALSFCVIGIVNSIITYYTYPIKVEISYEDESLSYFPGVTICNLNPQRKSQVNQRKRRGLYGSYFPEEESKTRTQDEIITTGHQIEDMLWSCSYKNALCTANDFVLVNGTIGTVRWATNCFTFNSILSPFSAENELLTGRDNGLMLTLDTQLEDYLDRTAVSGFNILLHDPDEYPTPDSRTISISPGSATYIELSLVS